MVGKRSFLAIEEKNALLADLSRSDLIKSWFNAHGRHPPKGVKRGLLERDHAYRLQARAFGHQKPATLKKLLSMARGDEVKRPSAGAKLKPGSRLVREWHGVAHQVDVTTDGCMWNGERYSSLSAVARAITGARWSGPRFFGL